MLLVSRLLIGSQIVYSGMEFNKLFSPLRRPTCCIFTVLVKKNQLETNESDGSKAYRSAFSGSAYF